MTAPASANFGTAWAFARRELRGGLTGFRIFLACLTLGVTAIAGVGSFSASIMEGLRKEGRSLLGGDLEVRLVQREINAEERAALNAAGALAVTADLRGMAKAVATDERTLVDLKGVDGAYPLFGKLELEPALTTADALSLKNGVPGVVVEESLARRLKVTTGSLLKIGDRDFELRAIIKREPDRAGTGFAVGPRAMVSLEGLRLSGLVTEGSLVNWSYHIRLANPDQLAAVKERLKTGFPHAGWRVRDFSDGAPGVRQFVERVSLFLTLVGLTALVIGGVGVGNAVKGYLDGKTRTIAILKCLGAPGGLIFRVYLIQVLMIAGVGIALGLVFGAFIPMAMQPIFAADLPVPAQMGIYPMPLLLATVYGVLTALAFAIWPLARAREVPAARLFRDLVAPERPWPRPAYVLLTLFAGAGLAILAVALADDRRLAFWFVGSAIASFIALRLTAEGLILGARAMGRPRIPSLRIALANLYRPGAPTAGIVLSLGLGLTLLVAVGSIDTNIARQVHDRVPAEAPAFFFVDIQSADMDRFKREITALPGVSNLQTTAQLRGRIAAIKGVPADKAQVAEEGRWALRGDRGLTYATTPPEGSEVVRGKWWPADYAGPPLISLDEEIAKAFGMEIGDKITVNILGRDIEAQLGNTRRINWGSVGMNFTFIFAPGTLERAPHTFLATLRATPESEDEVYRRVTDLFPNVSTVRVKEAIERVNGLLTNLAAGVRATSIITILAGILVLAGAMAAGHRHRVYDAVVLKVLGATRARVLGAYLIEYAILGLVTALLATIAGGAASLAVVTYVMKADFVMPTGTMIFTALSAMALTVSLGLVGTWRALSVKAAPILRAP